MHRTHGERCAALQPLPQRRRPRSREEREASAQSRGGSFYADPHGWVLDDVVPVTNPNTFIFWKAGRGKSANRRRCCCG